MMAVRRRASDVWEKKTGLVRELWSQVKRCCFLWVWIDKGPEEGREKEWREEWQWRGLVLGGRCWKGLDGKYSGCRPWNEEDNYFLDGHLGSVDRHRVSRPMGFANLDEQWFTEAQPAVVWMQKGDCVARVWLPYFAPRQNRSHWGEDEGGQSRSSSLMGLSVWVWSWDAEWENVLRRISNPRRQSGSGCVEMEGGNWERRDEHCERRERVGCARAVGYGLMWSHKLSSFHEFVILD